MHPPIWQIVQALLEEVRHLCKKLGHSRYKYAILISYGEKAGQQTLLSSKCLWDPSTDGIASISWHNEAAFCSCQVVWVKAWYVLQCFCLSATDSRASLYQVFAYYFT